MPNTAKFQNHSPAKLRVFIVKTNLSFSIQTRQRVGPQSGFSKRGATTVAINTALDPIVSR